MSDTLTPGTRVQVVLLDEDRTVLPTVGTVLPVSEWPEFFPVEWTEENTVIVRWDSEEGRKPFTPYRSEIAERVLRVLDDAPTEATPSLVVLDRTEAVAERALAALVEWRKAGDVQAHILATVALRKAADEYIAAVTR